MKKRVLAILMTLVMVVALMPATAFAKDYHLYGISHPISDKIENVSGTVTFVTKKELPKTIEISIAKKYPSKIIILENKTIHINGEKKIFFDFRNIRKYFVGEERGGPYIKIQHPDGFYGDFTLLEQNNTNGKAECEINYYLIDEVHMTGDIMWNDDNNKEGNRPNKCDFTIVGQDVVTKKKCIEEKIKLAGRSSWKQFLPEYTRNGNEIEYDIIVPDSAKKILEECGYEYNITKTDSGFDIELDNHKIINLSGSICWFDGDNADKVRPESVNIKLAANGEEVDSVTVTEKDDWKWSFDNVYKYENGKKIAYTYSVDSVEGYASHIKDNQINFSRVKDIIGSVTWDDADNQDGIRPKGMSIVYVIDGKEASAGPMFFETPERGKNYEEFFLLENCPLYDEDGNKIDYDIKIEGFIDDGFGNHPMTTYTVEKNGLDLKLVHEPEKVDLTGDISWIDNNGENSKRPESVKVHLLADDEIIAATDVTAEENWKWSFKDLDAFKEGNSIDYSYEVDDIENYRKIVNGDGTAFIETQNVTTEIVWDDADNQDGMRPEKVVTALKTGNLITEFKYNEPADWLQSWTVDAFDKQGKRLEYVTELHEDSKTALENAGYTITINGHDVKLFRAVEVIDIQGQITWEDADNQDGRRPESVNVDLFANGEKTDTVAVTAENGWKWSFEGIDKNKAGEEIKYTVQQGAVEGYTSVAEGNGFTYTHEPEQTTLPVAVRWCDGDNADEIRPESVNAVLFADGEKTEQTLELTADNDWNVQFAGLDKYKSGREIEYTYEISDAAGYEKIMTAEGAVFLQEKEYTANIIWDDADNQDGLRPESVTVNLIGKDSEDEVSLNGDGWNASWTKTAFDAEGKDLEYEIEINEEEQAKLEETGYTIEVDAPQITLSHAVETVDITGEIIWDDADDQDDKRPESVNVDLFANGEKTDTVAATGENGWKWIFEAVDKNETGKEIEYTVQYAEVEGYTFSAEGNTVTYVHEPEVIETEPPTEYDEPSEQTAPSEQTEPAEPSEPMDSIDQTEVTVPSASTEPDEPSVPTEPIEQTDSTVLVESSEPAVSTESEKPEQAIEKDAPADKTVETVDKAVPSGDDFNLGLYMIIAMMALVVAGTAVRRKTSR